MIGTKLGQRYEISGELGRGGMGVVYRARDPLLSREVAVKLLPPRMLTSEAETRFLREAQIVAQMDHPGIVPIFDIGRHDDASLYFVMPVVRGTNLRILMQGGLLSLGDVLDIAILVAEALEHSHTLGVIHRDVKPENIMVTRDDEAPLRVRVMDFGLAVAASEKKLTRTGMVVGTASYLSPEQASAQPIDARSDVYSLGAVLFECLAGEPPFTGELKNVLYRIVHEIPRSPRSAGADIREELDEIILSCLQKEPSLRPQRAGELAELLRRHRAKLQDDERSKSVSMATTGRTTQLPRVAASPFIGRDKEFTELQRRLNSSIVGECQFALIAGQPGIGKTRLLDELRTLARARKIRVLYGRFMEQDRTFSYQGFCELIQEYFRTRETGSQSSSGRADFSDLAADLIALFPVLSEIHELRAAAQGDSKLNLAAETRRAEDRIAIFELLARTMTRMGGGKPMVLILENLHSAHISIEALQYIVRRLGPTPTLIAGSYRPTEVDKAHPLSRLIGAFDDDPRFVSIPLGPFSAAEHERLVESVVGSAKLAPGLAARIYEGTEGNPFFTKELVRSLIDSGGLVRDESGAFTFSVGTGLAAVLPATIQQAVEKRIERLSNEVRDILALASILGKQFEYRDLEALVEQRIDLEDTVDHLVRDGLLEEDRESRGDRLSFASGIVRDVLYGSLSRRKRRSLHRRYAELLEKRFATKLDRVYPQLLHHFSQGDVPDKAVEYALKQATTSLHAFSPDETIRVTRIALEFLQDEEWPGEPSLEGEARLLLAKAHLLAGNIELPVKEAEEALKTLPEGELSLEAVRVAAEASWQARKSDETRRFVARGVPMARELGNRTTLLRLLSMGGTVASLRGEHQLAQLYLAEMEGLTHKAGAEEIPAGGKLVVALANAIGTIEPAASITIEESEVLTNVFEPLVTTDPQGNLVPCLASEWVLDDGGKAVRLRLLPGALFSDGTPLTSDLVKRSLERSISFRRDDLPAAFTGVTGVEAFVAGEAPDVTGIRAPTPDVVEILLAYPLPIYPAFLTDTATAIVHRIADGSIVGTGPFRIASESPEAVVLERNPRYGHGPPARLDRIEFRMSIASAQMAQGLRAGSIDLAHDLLPQDLEPFLRDREFRSALAETTKRSTTFVQYNTASAALRNVALRQALSGAVRSQDIVWGVLGRFALAASGFIPPGVLGHDPGRRRVYMPREKAVEQVRGLGLTLPLRLHAAVHPILQDRYKALTTALFAIWAELGVEVTVVTATMSEYIDAWSRPNAIDILIGRWFADYDDPDNFSYSLFHSQHGLLRTYFSSPDVDRLLDEARSASRPSVRQTLYRKFEARLLGDAVLLPLFHDIDYRVASPSIRGLSLSSTPPFVNYRQIGKAQTPKKAPQARTEGTIRVPIGGVVKDLEPSSAYTIEQGEVLPNVFETLTRVTEGARVIPWLASEVTAENEGARFRFKLRPGVRFHDGRTLTARDVRFSFERLLERRQGWNTTFLSPVVGAQRLIAGEAGDLEGFRIVSPLEFTIDLEKPVSFFPVLLSNPAVGIVPEGTAEAGVGTGPFRLVSFEPEKQLTLERNPDYWREGLPKSEQLVFRFGVPSEEIKDDFLSGRFSIASDLYPADVEACRRDPALAAGYHETPLLSTYFLGLNARTGSLADELLRKGLASSLRAVSPSIVRRTLGRLALPATSLIPPGLPGHSDHPGPSSKSGTLPGVPVPLSAAVHPVFFGEYGAFLEELTAAFLSAGFLLRPVNKTLDEFREQQLLGSADLVLGRWIADYPDADSFVHGVLHTQGGYLSRYIGRPELDELADRGRAEIDPATRHALYTRAEELIAREALVIPLFHEQAYRIARPEIEGLTLSFAFPVVAYENLSVRRI